MVRDHFLADDADVGVFCRRWSWVAGLAHSNASVTPSRVAAAFGGVALVLLLVVVHVVVVLVAALCCALVFLRVVLVAVVDVVAAAVLLVALVLLRVVLVVAVVALLVEPVLEVGLSPGERFLLPHGLGMFVVGGVGDALALVVGLVLQAQLRHAQGLHTWWALADGKWAFDVASRHAMLLGVFQAGVRGPDWLILDDVMAQDHQCLCLHGLLSSVFMLLRGTAQGRCFSVHVFNAQLRGLADGLADVLPQGCSTIVPPFARAALLDAVEDAPPVHCAAPPRGELQLDGVVREASRLAAAYMTPWPRARHFLSGALSELSSLADRIDVVERSGSHHLASPQFVDDIATPCPSEGAVRAVLSEEEWSACSRYARRVKGRFNYEKGKTAALPLLGAPPPLSAGAPVVLTRCLLGVLVGADLTFQLLLQETLARGRSLFEDLLQAAERGGFSVPVTAAQVPPRVESVIVYASPLLALAAGAEASLNRLQVEWGRKLLGCHMGPPVRHSEVVAQCGWPLRLGTKFLERALMTQARLAVLPLDHPASWAWQASRNMHVPSWDTAVTALAGRLPSPPAMLDRHPACVGEQLEGELPATLPRCGACGAVDVGVDHPLVTCRATAVHQDLLARGGPHIQDVAPELALQVLFCEGLPSLHRVPVQDTSVLLELQ
ncbi:unnamed protein product [Prorocentrum cordatum]|uniref:Uncharacterized protein n=1 Tax=Prorocentrum cordatum TaxID=2364126 RepID=A0ABN9UIG2_9DINO|nr:unnamed protein product [Polarella glacialis]